MRFSEYPQDYDLIIEEKDNEILNKHFRALDSLFKLTNSTVNKFYKYVEVFKEKYEDDSERCDDLSFMMRFIYINIFYDLIVDDIRKNHLSAEEVKNLLNDKESVFRQKVDSIRECFSSILDECKILHDKESFDLFDEKNLKDLITERHTLNDSNNNLNYYVNPEKALNLSAEKRKDYAVGAKGEVLELLQSEDKENLYKIAIIYQNVKRQHEKGFIVFNWFKNRWKEERRTLKTIKALIRGENGQYLLGSNQKREEFVNYLDNPYANKNLGLSDLKSAVYAPMCVGLINETLKKEYEEKCEKEKIKPNYHFGRQNLNVSEVKSSSNSRTSSHDFSETNRSRSNDEFDLEVR